MSAARGMTPEAARIVACLERALDHAGGTHRWRPDVTGMLLRGEAQWWQQDEGAAITEVVQYPQFRAVRYWLVGGRMADVLALNDRIEPWAREQGAVRLEAVGRPGWTRALAPLGFRPIGVALRKDLGP